MPGPAPRPADPATLATLLADKTRCQALIAATDAIVWTVDPERGFVEPQPSWEAYTGQQWNDYREHGWVQAVHPDDRTSLLRSWTLALRQGVDYHASCRLWHAASQTHRQCVVRAIPVRDAQARVVEWVGAVTDVHDRPMSLPEMHRLNEALKQQLEAHHHDLERLFSVSLDIMVTLAADGRILTLSPSFEAVTGVAVAQAQGTVFERFVHPDDLGRTWDEIRRVLGGEYNAVDFETRLLHADGSVRLVSWRAVGSLAESRIYAVGRDITERRRSEQRMVRMQRLEAVGQLTGGIAHDFNNILSAMLSFIEVARRQAGDPERLRKTLERAADTGRRGAALVQQLLAFARKQELSLGPVDLNELVSGMNDLLERSLGGTISVAIELQPGLPPALADRTQLESVLLNLCINARDAMPQGGRLTVRTRRHAITGDPHDRVDDLPAGDYTVLSVQDDGIGMDEATLARCCEPFFTTKPPGQGTGLGLAQVLGAVQQCGGTVLIHSRPGAGTTADVVLPQAQWEPAQAAPPEKAAPPSLCAGTVLVVDDNADVLASTCALLEAFGFQPIPAHGADEAMAVVLTGRPFDVMLTDYAMPGMNGADLVEDALRHRPKLTAILVTGFSDLAPQMARLPALTVLKKPFEPEQVIEAVEAAINAHRLKTGEH